MTDRTRILFMGTPEFAVPSLRILAEGGYAIAGVVTAPDKPRGRGQQVSFTAVKDEALRLSIPVLQPVALRDPTFVATLNEIAADIIVVVAFRILPPEVFTLPRLGCFNLHASLLPKYRGAAPINWAIMNGDMETGVTTFLLEEKVDTGSLLLQARMPILNDDTAGTVHDRLAAIGADIVLRTVQILESGTAHPQVQDNTLASPAPKIFKDDCRLDWSQSARTLHNRVRGLSPVPTAWTTLDGQVLKVFRSSVADADATGSAPGTIVQVGRSRCVVQAGAGLVSLDEVMLEGRKRLGIEEFLRGHRLDTGVRLGV